MVKRKKTFKVNTNHESMIQVEDETNNTNPNISSDGQLEREISDWENEDKNTLLLALKMHGENNLDAISQMLPHIAPKAIKKKIAVYLALAEHLYEDKLIDNWIASGMCREKVLADAIYFISLLENDPHSATSKEVSFRNIYKLIYQMFNDSIEATELIKKKELELVLTILDNLDKTIWPKSMNELFDYLSRNYKKRDIRKVYKGQRVSTL